MTQQPTPSTATLWARFRFSVIGSLLSAPPPRGELKAAIGALAEISETTEDLVHGFSQAIQKRGLPRALLTDNGAAMVSDEFTEGLFALGIVHEKTLPYSPHQNGKQERLSPFPGGYLGRSRASRAGLSDRGCSR
jgi:hypothetical protein